MPTARRTATRRTSSKSATTTAKKTATKKAEPTTAYGRVNKLIEQINRVYNNAEGGSYKFYNPQIQFVDAGFQVRYYKGNKGTAVTSVEELETHLIEALEGAKRDIPITVRSLTNYGDSVVIGEKGLTIGCRRVSFAKFDELAKAVATFRERQTTEKASTKTKAKTKTATATA